MQNLTLYINNLKKIKAEDSSFYAFLISGVINLRVKKEFIFLSPNYKKINFVLNLYFKCGSEVYNIIIDGKNQKLIAGDISLVNINKIALKFLKVDKNKVIMF